MVDVEKLAEENWSGECTDCGWSHSDMAFAGVNAEARVHIHNESSHSVEVYRDDELMEVIDSLETGSDTQYLTEESAPLRERK
jgi:hypothetical protein